VADAPLGTRCGPDAPPRRGGANPIAHLQIASLLETARAPLTDQHRAGVYLTNALTGWVPERHPQSVIFREFEKEREDSEQIKQQGTILVILGNPPYNGYAGIAQIDEERDLTTAYREQIPGLPAPQGQGLNDLYVRFFRIAERRIVGDAHVHGNEGGSGIVSFISNSNWLDGLSHVSMRKRYIDTFQSIYIDNLNGDKYRTGKTTPEGLPDPSAFSTPQNREGIQVGTAIATLVRTSSVAVKGTGLSEGYGLQPVLESPTTQRALAPEGTAVRDSRDSQIHLRDLWGTGKLAKLQRESRRESEPEYSALSPAPALGNPLAHRAHSASYASWPRLPDLFPDSSPGVQTGRDDLVTSIDREALQRRMQNYLDPNVPDEEADRLAPGIMKDTGRFKAKAVRAALQGRGYKAWQISQFAYRPFDTRWLYWEPTTKLLDEKREEYMSQYLPTAPSMYLAQKNRMAFDPPGITYLLANRHLNERGANAFPMSSIGEPLPGKIEIRNNLTLAATNYLAQVACDNQPDLFFHAISAMHSPHYRSENEGALMSDWPRIPLPATLDQLTHSATLGRRLAELLDAESSVNLAAEWSFLAALKLPLDPNLDEALKLTAGWGHKGQGSTVMPGRGLAPERPRTEAEHAKLSALAVAQSLTLEDTLALLGETCVDVHLNGDAYWSAVPTNVWNYTLGGYQVLKKWLSYREFTPDPASPLLHRALRPEEAAYFAQVVRRIAATLLLGPALDASYRAILPTATGLSAAAHR
jgi:hypothetical protein